MYQDFKCLINEFKKGASEDRLGLWEIIHCVKKNFSPNDESELMALTLLFVREMLSEGYKAGTSEYSEGGYVPFGNQDAQSVCDYIETEWKKLGKIPSIGDIAYFDI